MGGVITCLLRRHFYGRFSVPCPRQSEFDFIWMRPFRVSTSWMNLSIILIQFSSNNNLYLIAWKLWKNWPKLAENHRKIYQNWWKIDSKIELTKNRPKLAENQRKMDPNWSKIDLKIELTKNRPKIGWKLIKNWIEFTIIQ